jgi:hypothetical protein
MVDYGDLNMPMIDIRQRNIFGQKQLKALAKAVILQLYRVGSFNNPYISEISIFQLEG